MKLLFMKKKRDKLALYMSDPYKYSDWKNGDRPEGFTEKLKYEGPDAARRHRPFESDFDPYLARDIQQEMERIERWKMEEQQYLTAQAQANLKRQKARYGTVNSRWTHMKRCPLCEHDNMCYEEPGEYQCQAALYGKRCIGRYLVTQLDAARMKHMRPEDRVPYTTLADRYDYDAIRTKNATRTKALKYATRT